MSEQNQPSADPRRARILEGAMKVFLAYGFSRTTMDDIARAADLSRPALYLVFKNKTDIFRALGTELLESSVARARVALAAEGSFADRMMSAIDMSLITMMQSISESPHGDEILDMKNSLAHDLIGVWRKELAGLFGAAIELEARRTGVGLPALGLSALQLSDMLLDALEGMKARVTDPADQRVAVRGLVQTFSRALRA